MSAIINRFANINVLQHGTGLTITIIGFAIWPDLTHTQLLKYAIKTRPTVLGDAVQGHLKLYCMKYLPFTYGPLSATRDSK